MCVRKEEVSLRYFFPLDIAGDTFPAFRQLPRGGKPTPAGHVPKQPGVTTFTG